MRAHGTRASLGESLILVVAYLLTMWLGWATIP
jgi:hypothetical protein